MEARFSNFEQMIEVRIQSLYLDVDKILENFLDQISVIEKIDTIKMKRRKRMKFETRKFITKTNIGFIYNEKSYQVKSEKEELTEEFEKNLDTSENDSDNTNSD